MEIQQKPLYYVYCFGCGKVIFKGNLRGAVGTLCKEKTHKTQFGTKRYFNIAYPELDLEQEFLGD